MSTDPSPAPPPKRRRRWLRGLAVVAGLTVLALALLGVFAVRHLDWIAKFAIHRIFPGVTAQLGSLRAVSASRLEVSQLTLQSTKSHETLLSLEGGVIVFSFGDVWRARLEEVRLTAPDLVVSPDLGEALGIQPAMAEVTPTASGNGFQWAIGRLVVTDGHLLLTRFGESSPSVEMQFSTDLENFGVGGGAGHVEHTAQLTRISARDASRREFLDLAAIDIRFTTEALFTNRHVAAIHVGKGSLTVSPNLIKFFQPRAETSPASSAPSPPGWTVGDLTLDGADVTIANAPGPIGRASFRLAASLQNLGAVGTAAADSEQRVTATRVKVATDAEPSIPLLTTTGAEVRFTISGLANRRIEELRLENPTIDANLSKLLPAGPRSAATPPVTPSNAEPPVGWLIARASCDYGTLALRGLQDGALNVSAHFAFDVTDLGTAGDAEHRPQEITLWDVQAGRPGDKPFLSFDVGGITFTPVGLLEQRHIDAVKINGGRLTVGNALQKLLASNAKPAASAPPSASAEPGWSIGTLDIAGVRTRIEDKRPGVTDLHFTINTTLRDVRAGSATSALLEEVQTVEFANIDLRSPLNRDAKILSLRSVFVRFTLRDLARKHLREVVILQPSIFLSQDLFVYMERASATEKPVVASGAPAVPVEPVGPNWSVDHLEVKFGRLVIGSGGSKDVGLPLEFETTADNLSLDNLAALQLQAILRVPKQSYEFSAYQLAVNDAVGDLRFSYPPEKGEKNLVQKLEIASLRWRQYRAKNAWVAATFDASGINGLFGSDAYGGYVNGGFSFFFQDDSPWIGWVSGTGVDTEALTSIASPQNFSMTGPLDFEVQLDAFRKNIQRVRGVFRLTEPGRLKIGKLDAILADIPPTWNAIKAGSTRIALETLRDFDYTKAGGDFWFVHSQGILNLDLRGPHGSRKFEAVLHDGEETNNQWQNGKLGKK